MGLAVEAIALFRAVAKRPSLEVYRTMSMGILAGRLRIRIVSNVVAAELDAAVRTIAGSARSMGVTVEGVV